MPLKTKRQIDFITIYVKGSKFFPEHTFEVTIRSFDDLTMMSISAMIVNLLHENAYKLDSEVTWVDRKANIKRG